MSAATSLHDGLGHHGLGHAGLEPVRVTTLFTPVEVVCPHCGDERSATLVDSDDGVAFILCDGCDRELDVALLSIPTAARLERWRGDAVVHGTTAVQCADGIHGCSYLAVASFRRLADDLSGPGKLRLLDEVARSEQGDLSTAQRGVLLELGVALGLGAASINAFLALL